MGTTDFSKFTAYTDEKILADMAVKEPGAFDALYQRYGQKMFGYFYRMLWKDKELAEDQTQELFLKIIAHAKNFKLNASFSTWIYSIAHNMCKNEYRKNALKMSHIQNKRKEGEAIVLEKNIDLQSFKVAVANCMKGLTAEKQSLFILRFQEQLSVPEISKIMEIPEGTIKSRLFYLLKEMKENLIQYKTVHLIK